jgi:hypothetical protein
MPLGNVTGSATGAPVASRLDSQQSSTETVSNPASRSPSETKASIVAMSSVSFTLHAKMFLCVR